MRLVTADEMRALDRLTIEAGTPGHVLMERAGAGATRGAAASASRACARRGARADRRRQGQQRRRRLRHRAAAAAARRARSRWCCSAATAEVAGDAARNLRAYQRGCAARCFEVDRRRDAGARWRRGWRRADAGRRRDLRHRPEQRRSRGLPAAAIEMHQRLRRAGASRSTSRPASTPTAAGRSASPSRPRRRRPSASPSSARCMYPGVAPLRRAGGGRHRPRRGGAGRACRRAPRCSTPTTSRRWCRVRAPDAHKGDCGHVLIIAGSFGKTGAGGFCVTREGLQCFPIASGW